MILLGDVNVHVEPLIVALPLTCGVLLMVMVNDLLEPTVPVSTGAILSVVIFVSTVGIDVAVTTSSPVVLSFKPVSPSASTSYVPAAMGLDGV